ncbi:U2 small nuclear ribonucleoprotein auxiliary factor 35 kDa subunit-related protein 1-like [Acanthaster planci]|uniref:U2 small nuclear ribonucleoprotein auxiliary factor 35 kDa subunit-related protein 1-like n=1 Tax=Acanthaster planci TaxID=133434 RepID=A0A8B7Z5U9_ACAPL|nr:U2 small nuclear ribonucleoprotein auxiliary factor 35 kDa subunit-related protein 1-like [Acanthaster planci]
MDPERPCDAPKKLSHKQYKAFLKKEKRRCQRQAAAKFQAEQEAKNAPPDEKPSEEEVARLTKIEREEERKEEEERRIAHEAWLERERLAQEAFEQRKKKEEAQKQKLLEEQRRIQEEWEARQEKENQSQSKKERELEAVLQQLDKEIADREDGPTHNPEAPRQPQHVKQEPCSFFRKTGGCRFGDRCSRTHIPPEISTTLLFPHMYTDFTLEQSHRDEYDTDMGLEYDEGDAYERFLEFYDDVLPELKDFGTVVQFKVCCNWEPHLRGNVYVQFKTEEESSKAREAFHGRFYASRQLSCVFTPVNSWKAAICGMFQQNKCPRGKNCNFLHVFQNPNREFADADRDFQGLSGRVGQSQRGWRYDRDRSPRNRNRSQSRERNRDQRRRSRSRSRHRRKRSKERSRSRERRLRYSSSRRHRSRNRDRTRKKRSRTRSRSPSRSPYQSSRRHRSRSGSKSRQGSPRSPGSTGMRSQDQSSKHSSRNQSRHRESRSPNHPRKSRSRSVSPPKSQGMSKNQRSHNNPKDDKQSSSDSDDINHARTECPEKKCKPVQDKSRIQHLELSSGETLNHEVNTDGELRISKVEYQQQSSTNGDHYSKVLKTFTDRPLVKSETADRLEEDGEMSADEMKQDLSKIPGSDFKAAEDTGQSDLPEKGSRAGLFCFEGGSTGEDSEGNSEDLSKSLDMSSSRSPSKEKHPRHGHKRKHKHSHKKHHKRRRRLSPPSDV